MDKKLIKHLKTIHNHRKYVKQSCFNFGLYKQGLLHDLSKYSLKELGIYKFYSGKFSPHEQARLEIGYSPSWLNHYHKNKHHWQYWLDDDIEGKFHGIKIPFKYVIEMVADFVGAGKAYNSGNSWKVSDPWDY